MAIAKRLQLKDDREIEDGYPELKSFIQIKPYPSLDGFRTVFAEIAKRAPAENADPKYFDTRFIEKLDRSGFIDPL